MGLQQSLHLTTPTSDVDVRGRAPYSFMSFAESHNADGEGREDGSGGDGGRISQVKGEGGLLSGLSLSVIEE